MRVVRLPLNDLAAGTRKLAAEEAHYLLRVRRGAVGDPVVAFDPKTGHEARGTILPNGSLDLEEPSLVRDSFEITWVHALAKGDKCDAIVRDATELGATAVIFVKTLRSVLELEGGRAEKRVHRWEAIAKEAARQSERSSAPTVALASWRETLALPAALRICLYEGASTPLRECMSDVRSSCLFLTGPEGGFDPSEIAEVEAAGFRLASLGSRILRTETVPAAVLGALHFFGTSA